MALQQIPRYCGLYGKEQADYVANKMSLLTFQTGVYYNLVKRYIQGIIRRDNHARNG